jgi:hypothetical protein
LLETKVLKSNTAIYFTNKLIRLEVIRGNGIGIKKLYEYIK